MLSKFAIDFNGNINYVYNQLKEIKEKFPIYKNLINLYFRKHKLPFFISGEVNYSNLPIDCRTNNSLENYNKVMKLSLWKRKYVHWNNFLTFLKNESVRIIKKIFNNSNQNILFKSKYCKVY